MREFLIGNRYAFKRNTFLQLQTWSSTSGSEEEEEDVTVKKDNDNDIMIYFSKTFSGFYAVWAENMEEEVALEEFTKKVPYASFLHSWYSFLALLDVMSDEAMKCDPMCEECGPSPRLVVCDATSLGYQKKFASFQAITDDSRKLPTPRYRYLS